MEVHAILEALEIPGYSSFTILCPGRLASRMARAVIKVSPLESFIDINVNNLFQLHLFGQLLVARKLPGSLRDPGTLQIFWVVK